MRPQHPKFNPILIWVITTIYKLLALTWRKKVILSPEVKELLQSDTPFIVSYYHKHVNALLYITWKYKTATIASDSKDGQLITQILESLGAQVARGSTRHNPIKALKSFLKIIRKNPKLWSAIAVDGPKGPPEKVKPGITQVAKMLDAPVFTLNAMAKSKWVFEKSWDQTELPKPFSKVIYYFGPGIGAISKDVDPRSTQLLESLEKSMSRNEKVALGYL